MPNILLQKSLANSLKANPALPTTTASLEVEKRGLEKITTEFSKRVSNAQESILYAYVFLAGKDAEYKEAIRDYFNQSEFGSILGKNQGSNEEVGFFTKAMAHNPLAYVSDLIFGTIDNLIEVAHDETVYKLYCSANGEISWQDYQNILTKEEGFLRWERRVVLFGGQLLLGSSLMSGGQKLKMLCTTAQSAIVLSLGEEALNNSFSEKKFERSGDFLDSFLNNWGTNSRYVGTISRIGNILLKLQGVPNSLQHLAQAELISGMNVKSRIKFVHCVMGALDFFDDQSDIAGSISQLDQTGYQKILQDLEKGEYWKLAQTAERLIGAGVSIAQNFRNTKHLKRAGGYENTNKLLNPDNKEESIKIELPNKIEISGHYDNSQFVVDSAIKINYLYRHLEDIGEKQDSKSVAGFYHPKIQRTAVQETNHELDSAWKLHEKIHQEQYEGKSLSRRWNRLKYGIAKLFRGETAEKKWKNDCEVEALLIQQNAVLEMNYQLSFKDGNPDWIKLDDQQKPSKLSEEEIRNNLILVDGVTLTAIFSRDSVKNFITSITTAVANFVKPPPKTSVESRRGFFTNAAVGGVTAVTNAANLTGTTTEELGLESHLELLEVVDKLCGLEWDHSFHSKNQIPAMSNFDYGLQKAWETSPLSKVEEAARERQAEYQRALDKLSNFAKSGFSIPASLLQGGIKDTGTGRSGLQMRFRHFSFRNDEVITPELLAQRFKPDLLKDAVMNSVNSARNNQVLLEQAMRLEAQLKSNGVSDNKVNDMVTDLVRRIGWSFFDSSPPADAPAFEAAIVNAFNQQIAEIPKFLAAQAAEALRKLSLDKRNKYQLKFDFSQRTNRDKQLLTNLSTLFGGTKFQQDRGNLVVYSPTSLISIEMQRDVTEAVINLLKLAGVSERQFPSYDSDISDLRPPKNKGLFRVYLADNRRQRVPLEMHVPICIYFELRPSQAMALVLFLERQKNLLNSGLDLGVLTKSIATLQAFGKAHLAPLDPRSKQPLFS